jgi:putative CocE/NonD family hydrolase
MKRMEEDLMEKLKEVGLQMQPYWSAKYLKNIDKLSKPIYKTKEEKDIYALVRDGTKLCMDIFRPDVEGEKFPALVAWSSYGKVGQSHRRDPVPAGALLLDHSIEVPEIDFFVNRGYVFVIPEPRGIGKSEGEWNGMQSPQEQKDIYDIIEWIAQQPWCDGNVGMAGVSYFGAIQPLAAIQKPPHLKAIMPWLANLNFYDMAYPGGIISDFFHYFILTGNNPNNPVSESERLYTEEELKYKMQESLKDPYVDSNTFYVKILNTWPPRYNTWFLDILLHPLDGPFWQARSLKNKTNEIKIPTYVLGEWTVLDFYTDTHFNAPKKLSFVGKYREEGHPCPYRHTQEEMLRWYDHWFKGIDTGIMDEPPIKLYITGINRYRYEYEWPLARTKWTKLFLQQYKGLATSPPHYYDTSPDAFVHVPSDLRTLGLDVPSLVYSTERLNQPLEISGPGALYLYSAIDVEDGNFIVSLLDLSPDGRTRRVAGSALKASHRSLNKEESKPWEPIHKHTEAIPIKPSEINEYALAFSVSHVFQPGHRIGVEIKAASPTLPRYAGSTTINLMPSPWVTTYKIFHDQEHPSHLLLPVITETPEELWLDNVLNI